MQKTIQSESYRLLIQWLKTARTHRGVTMRELAARLNVPHTWIGKIEQCERRVDVCEFYQLCDALELDPHVGIDLLGSHQYGAVPRKKPPLAAERPLDSHPALKTSRAP
jgi:transcriptional regulator with XRE-family HTH domain